MPRGLRSQPKENKELIAKIKTHKPFNEKIKTALTYNNRIKSAHEVNKLNAGFYSSVEWQKLRDELLQLFPYCQLCGATNCRREVDHDKEIQDHPEIDPMDRNNLIVLCAPCHRKKTAIERAKRIARLNGRKF
jgi:5-methylcytosine-specific restriction endonuclease McrA